MQELQGSLKNLATYTIERLAAVLWEKSRTFQGLSSTSQHFSRPMVKFPQTFLHATQPFMTSLIAESCDSSLWLVIPDHLQCLLTHGGSINNKCFTKSIKKLSMNKSDETYCLRSLLHFGIINSTIFVIYLF